MILQPLEINLTNNARQLKLNLISHLKWTPTFENLRTNHKKNMCANEIILHAQNLLTKLFSIVNIIGDTKNGIIRYKESGVHAQNMLTILDLILNMIGGTYVST